MKNSTQNETNSSNAVTSHTPGPWYVEQPYGEPGIYVAATINTGLIAKLFPQDGHLFNRDTKVSEAANARLIAAAPELLEALKLAKPCVEYAEIATGAAGWQAIQHRKCIEALERLCAAIAKAEGKA